MLKKILIVLIPVLGVLAWMLLRGKEPPQVAVAPVVRETLVSTLTTNGRAEPLAWASVRSQSSGAVAEIHVSRGQTVQQGQVLVTLNAAEAQVEQATAQSKISQAKAELETLGSGGRATEVAEIESGLARARADLAAAQTEYETLKRLAAKKAATSAEVTAAQQTVEKAELQIQSLERRRGALVTSPDRTAAQARLQEALSSADAATKKLAASQIRSPVAGVVYSFDLKPGAFLNPGDEVAKVGTLTQLRVIVYVDEPELGRVEKGMPVTITWDALPGRKWTGTVESVPLQVVSLGTRQVGEVPCTIDNPDLSLIPGTNVNVEVRSRVVENALTVPKEALRREGNDSGVLKLEGERVVWQKVRLGAASVTRVQIVEGLSESDKVTLPTDAVLKSGDVVRAASRP